MEKDALLIDGLCALCTKSGQFISKRQSKALELVEQNSELGQKLLQNHNISIDSVVLIRNGKPFVRSSAAIRCLLYMKWNWKWIYPFAWIVPWPIRDLVYRIIAKFRKKI
ncbi:MAG: thiol-disulfide oxidoreductase DCC family protein [Candidatus Poseidoniaceae archaeon]